MPTLQQRLTRAIVMGFLAKVPQGLILFVMSEIGLFVAMGVTLNVPLNIMYSTKHVVLGALFGAFFAVPVLTGWSHTLRGLIVGFVHAAVVLMFINPYIDDVGFMGVRDLGPLFPVVSIVANLIWGVLTGLGIDLWDRIAKDAEEE
jgi:hypothetical protein